MPNKLQTFLRAVKSRFNDTAFGSSEAIDGGSHVRGRSGRSYWIPGTELNWAAIVGDLWRVPGAQACYNWAARNFVQAPPQVCVKDAEGEDQAVENHALIKLLLNPNPEYDYSTLAMGFLVSWFFDGNVYFGIERNRIGFPVELWWIPHNRLCPKRGDGGKIYYEYTVRGQTTKIPASEIVHTRFGLDPDNTLRGMAPLAAADRDGYITQQDITYRAKSLRNMGLMSGLITPDGVYPPGSYPDFEPADFINMLRQKMTGDRAGEPVAWTHPLKYEKVNASPQELLMETMSDRSEANICALFGIPPQVAGLHVGRLSKTWANMKEARESAWEECLLPTMQVVGMQWTRRLLPEVSRNFGKERVDFDISNIRPLQPDLDAKHERIGKDYERGIIDRWTAKSQLKYKAEEEDKGMYAKPGTDGEEMPEEKEEKVPKFPAKKSLPPFLLDYALRASRREQAYKAAFGDTAIEEDDSDALPALLEA